MSQVTFQTLLIASVLVRLDGKVLRAGKVLDREFHTWNRNYSIPGSWAELVEDRKSMQPPGVTETVSHESFFSRMSDAMVEFVLGLLLLVFSVPVLWFNEKRNAQYDTLTSRGEQQCREVPKGEYDSRNTNWLVHATGRTHSVKPVKDSQFNVCLESGAMKLHRRVEIYQWQEHTHEKKEERETLGGGKETVTRTWYSHEKKWLCTYNDGTKFHERAGHDNRKPFGIDCGSSAATCGRVEFGNGFVLTGAEIGQLGIGQALGPGVDGFPKQLYCEKNETLNFVFNGKDGFFYAREGSTANSDASKIGDIRVNSDASEIGDVRVQFHWLPDGEITIVGLQSEGTGQIGEGSFLPFRVIQRPLCSCFGLSEEEEKELLRQEAEKPLEAYQSEAIWGSIIAWCFCWPCNIVSMCCASALYPELHHVYHGNVAKTECFKRIQNDAAAQKWLFRLLGWGMMFIGLCACFSPFTTLLKVLPFVGPFLSSVSGAIVSTFSFIVTVIVAILIISAAYLIYHPLMGMLVFGGLAFSITSIVALTQVMVKPHAA